MDKDKIITWVTAAALLGSAFKMVKELQAHGEKKELIGDVEVIDDEQQI